MTDWYFQTRSSEEVGPLRPSELLEKVRKGEVTRNSMLRKNSSTWFLASEVGGLFEAAMRPTIEYFCPQCEAEVGEPPTVCNLCGCEIYKAITKITENSITNRADHPSTRQASRKVRDWIRKKVGKDNKKTGENN
ncbi:hypothetical protein K227x_12230 [Rubripirellula lacrimiformis]|uniref:GYF domain-containing protein n=1 Tax=Rubripirellula lacrimiformis TaxID=1930273 RepID=A0A517N6R6_9BACT|nr:GYF domain-containing protein [Rubripirellula lacrimiformis]QDT02844.1 hypothetical protein K227x_12230 [Rubripirellula lacrimiformis]